MGERVAKEGTPPSVYVYTDYKKFIEDTIEKQPNEGWGVKSQLAKALKCETSFISQVLNGDSNFSLEQGFQVAQFFKLDDEEAEFFLLLVNLARAGNVTLQNFYQKRISLIRNVRLSVTEKFRTKASLTKEEEAKYFSSWIYAAVHAAMSISKLQNVDTLSSYLGVRKDIVDEALKFLVASQLLKKTEKSYELGVIKLHLGKESAMVSKHHGNWRVRALRALETAADDKQLHYSSVVTISESDIAVIQESLLEGIARVKEKISASQPERLYSLNFDFFELSK